MTKTMGQVWPMGQSVQSPELGVWAKMLSQCAMARLRVWDVSRGSEKPEQEHWVLEPNCLGSIQFNSSLAQEPLGNFTQIISFDPVN